MIDSSFSPFIFISTCMYQRENQIVITSIPFLSKAPFRIFYVLNKHTDDNEMMIMTRVIFVPIIQCMNCSFNDTQELQDQFDTTANWWHSHTSEIHWHAIKKIQFGTSEWWIFPTTAKKCLFFSYLDDELAMKYREIKVLMLNNNKTESRCWQIKHRSINSSI